MAWDKYGWGRGQREDYGSEGHRPDPRQTGWCDAGPRGGYGDGGNFDYGLRRPVAGGHGGPGDYTGQQGGFSSLGHEGGYDQGGALPLKATPLARVVSEQGVVALRSALAGILHGALQAQEQGAVADVALGNAALADAALREAATRNDALRRAVRLMCIEARRQEVRIEQLLVTFKTAWRSLPEVQQLPPAGASSEHKALFDCLVTLCIEEFYAANEGRA